MIVNPLSTTPGHEHVVYQHAYHLTTLGFTVFPLHFVRDDSTCSCGDAACTTNAGKHPMVKWSTLESPEMAIQQVHRAIARYGWCNLGLVTGKKRGRGPGLVTIDLDVKDGRNGIVAFEGWSNSHGVSPESLDTARATTGSGGRHLVFLHPENDIKISSRANVLVNGGGIDVRGDGGYIVVAPSRHRSGGCYTWEVEPSIETLKPLPQALIDALQGGKRVGGEPDQRTNAPYTPTLDDLADLATELARSKNNKTRAVGKNLKLIVRGEPIAENGGGHDAYRDVLMAVGLRWSQAEPRETIEHFRASVEARQRIRPEASCGMEDLLDSLVSAQGKARAVENSWRGRLARRGNGPPIACEGNIVIALEQHPGWKGVLGHNDRTQETNFMRQPPIESCVGPYPRAITDADVAQVAKWATTEVPMAVSTKQCATVMRAVGRSATYEPFRDWLESLPPWDGIARAGMWLITCAGAVDSQYTREVSLRWLLQAVWRTYVPGSQADYVLILEGPQGIRKSTLLAALVPSEIYFVDHVPKIGTKDAAIALLGPVIVEIAELSALRRTESEAMKAFLTTKYDSIRLPYDKLNTMLPRRCVIAGTTNDDAYLRDATGNRRYWPVSVTSCDPILLAANRDQLWAELVARYKAGDRCYLDGPTEALAVVEQEGRYESDSWHDPIVAWLARATAQQVVRVADDGGFPLIVRRDQIYQHALLIGSRDRWTQATDKRLAAVMRTLGYLSSPITIDGVKTRAYVRS